MIEVYPKEKCCGCSACYNACPVECINMVTDEEGFLYPLVDEDSCINCGLCEKVCPMLNTNTYDIKPGVYACINKDEDIRFRSSSGGCFSVLAKYVLENDGVVFGAAFDENFEVKHIMVDNENDLQRLRGSKYVQSDINVSYKQAKKYLELNKLVLFSGTPCQVAGLKNYLGKDYNNLILMDLVCHGVPSPGVFSKYLSLMESNFNSKVTYISFRPKQPYNSALKIKFYNGRQYLQKANDNYYFKAFLSNLILRPSCYACKHNNLRSGSDITIGDYWGVSNKFPDFDDQEGVSLVIVKSNKGKDLFNKVKGQMEYRISELEDAIKYNYCIVRSVPENAKREKFFNEYKEGQKTIDKLLEKYINMKFIKDDIKNLENTKVAIFGTGEIGREVYNYILNLNEKYNKKIKVEFFLDNNKKMWSKELYGKPVLKPGAQILRDIDFVLITSISGKKDMVKQLNELGVYNNRILILV